MARAILPIFTMIVMISVHVKITFFLTSQSLAISKELKNNTILELFIMDCVKCLQMKQPKIFVSKEIDGQFLHKNLSYNGIQALVRTNFKIDQLGDIVFRDAFTHILVADKRKAVLEILAKLSKMRVLDKRGLLLLICTDCHDRNEFIKGEDSIATILLCSPVTTYKDTDYNIQKLHFSYPSNGFTMTDIGDWNRRFGFSIDNGLESLKEKEIYNFQGKTLKILAVKTPLYLRNVSTSEAEMSLAGMMYDLLLLTSQQMNFTYNLSVAGTYYYGDFNQATPKGVLSEFVETKSDVCFGLFSKTANRMELVHFSTPFSTDKISISMQTASKINVGSWILGLRSFSWHFWLAIIGLTALVGLLLRVVLRITASGGKEECAPLLLSIISLQGNECSTKSQSLKIVILTSYMFYWMTFAVYNGVLVTFLTLDTSPRMTTLDEILQSDYKLLVTNEGHIIDMLKHTKNPKMEAIRSKLHTSDTLVHGVKEMCTNPGYAHAFDKAVMYYLLKDYPECEVYSIKEVFYYDYYHVLSRKDAVLHIRFSKLFNKMKEVGVMRRLEYKNDVMEYLNYKRPEYNDWVEIGVQHVLLPFGIITSGLILSIVALFFEMLNQRLRKMSLD